MTPQKATPRRRLESQNGSGSRVHSSQRDELPPSHEKEPDPSTFEPEFAIGDDDSALPSRTATPRPDVPKKVSQSHGPKEEEDDTKRAAAEAPFTGANGVSGDTTAEESRPQAMELPSGVQTKLRKLERLETKYGDLLKAYRIAHARCQVIDPFEAKLREHTPLTNIGDPSAFVEYLNQATAKSDMVMDEFKRVSAERNDFKTKAEASDATISSLRREFDELKNAQQQSEKVRSQEGPASELAHGSEPWSTSEVIAVKQLASPAVSLKSPISTSSRIPSFSMFSPRSKPTSPPPREPAEEFFSYDSELPRVEAELEERRTQVADLQTEMGKLKGDLVVARESTEGMVVSLESASHELNELRDARDKFEEVRNGLEKRIKDLEANATSNVSREEDKDREMGQLLSEKDSVTTQIDGLKQSLADLKRANAKLEEKLEANQKEIEMLNEKLGQNDSTVKDLEDSLAMEKSATRQEAAAREGADANEKKISTMQGIMQSLRSKLDGAEETVQQLRQDIKTNDEQFSSQPSSKAFGFLDQDTSSEVGKLSTQDELVGYLATRFGLQKERKEIGVSTEAIPNSESPSSVAGKKNKKKKRSKGGKAAAEELKAESAPGVDDEAEPESSSSSTTTISKLEAEIERLRTEIVSKVQTIETLNSKAHDQETLREEIETLRDDLLHQGEEHVEARDALKVVRSEKETLSSKVEELEKELLEVRGQTEGQADFSAAHEKTLVDLEELQGKFAMLETDLKAAEQLAASRFKDLAKLREALGTAQPELKSLRIEVTELGAAKEDLKNKTGELSRLEAKYDDLKAELKGLGRRLSDKDSETKELQLKIEQETSRRVKTDDDLYAAQSNAQSTESRRKDLAETLNKVTEDLRKSKGEASQSRAQLSSMEEQTSVHAREVSGLKEELSLKTALHSSAQALVQSLRDQTHELTTQAREAIARAESLEEELTEAQRMLSERTKEGQTMRMLLNQSETGTESRIREMKQRMDSAIEERDRVEDEASVSSRRTIRELDEAKSKVRDLQRALRLAEAEREDLDLKRRDWSRQQKELEQTAARSAKEIDDVRGAMTSLREALDDSERQLRDMETQKADLRRMSDEAKDRIEKLTKANQHLTGELGALQIAAKKTTGRAGLESGVQSSRASTESTNARPPVPGGKQRDQLSTTTSRSDTPTGLSQGTVDYVYLKNVLLQFIEQKDKAHQRQLIPVIGMMLHFDG